MSKKMALDDELENLNEEVINKIKDLAKKHNGDFFNTRSFAERRFELFDAVRDAVKGNFLLYVAYLQVYCEALSDYEISHDLKQLNLFR